MSSNNKDSFKSRAILVLGDLRTPHMVTWLRKLGMARTDRGAGRLLLLVMFACILVTVVTVKEFILPNISVL